MARTVLIDMRGQGLDLAPIRPMLERILVEYRPVEIRLFGSRARGEGRPNSDWDLFVIVPDELEAACDPFAGYDLRYAMRIRADVILCPLSEYREDCDIPNTLAYEAAHHGISIYEC